MKMPGIEGLEIVAVHEQPDGSALYEWRAPIRVQNAVAAWCVANNMSTEEFLTMLLQRGLEASRA